MEPSELADRLERLDLPRPEDLPATDWLRALERAAEAAPWNRALAAAIPLAADLASVLDHTPAVLAGVRRERLVRWDAVSSTWLGTAVDHATPTMVRALRPEVARDAVLRRWLAREGEALLRVLPIRADEPEAALRVEVSGFPLWSGAGPTPAHPLLSGLARLAEWEAAGLGLPTLVAEELRVDEGGRVRVVCLSPGEGGVSRGIAALARALRAGGDGPLPAVLRGLAELPPATVDEAGRAAREALAETLTRDRHEIARRFREGTQRRRAGRLVDQVRRLAAAVPPPTGRGAVGVDLDGRITVLEASPRAVTWGPLESPELLWDPVEGFRPPLVRRLLRARASSPPNASLNARVGGDAATTEAVCRWAAAGLKLRTVQLLLDREPG